jgi:hypothetical protein
MKIDTTRVAARVRVTSRAIGTRLAGFVASRSLSQIGVGFQVIWGRAKGLHAELFSSGIVGMVLAGFLIASGMILGGLALGGYFATPSRTELSNVTIVPKPTKEQTYVLGARGRERFIAREADRVGQAKTAKIVKASGAKKADREQRSKPTAPEWADVVFKN